MQMPWVERNQEAFGELKESLLRKLTRDGARKISKVTSRSQLVPTLKNEELILRALGSHKCDLSLWSHFQFEKHVQGLHAKCA